MEIQALKLLVTEQALNDVLARETRAEGPVRDVAVSFTADGIRVRGKYHMVVPMPFDSHWRVEVADGCLVAHLVDVKVAAFGASMIKGMLLSVLAESIPGGALESAGDSLKIDLDRLLAERGFPARTNLKSVRYEPGKLFIECSIGGDAASKS